MSVKRYMSKVAALGCIVCRNEGFGESPAVLHHIREGQGGAQRASDWLVIPLCPTHHDGSQGVHKNRGLFERRFRCTELDLLADVIRLTFKG